MDKNIFCYHTEGRLLKSLWIHCFLIRTEMLIINIKAINIQILGHLNSIVHFLNISAVVVRSMASEIEPGEDRTVMGEHALSCVPFCNAKTQSIY